MKRFWITTVVGVALNVVAYFALPWALDFVLPRQQPSSAPASMQSAVTPTCDLLAYRRSTCT
mgnify:CR=1 FL=1